MTSSQNLPDIAPSPWIIRHASLIAPGASILDLACGHGRHARFFAARGAHVLAVDRDADALHATTDINTEAINASSTSGSDNTNTAAPRIQTLTCDLEAENAALPWLAPDHFDAIVVTRYLHRPLFPRLLAALRPNGVLLYETFMRGHERYGKPSRPAFLLQPNELLDIACDAGMTVLAFEQGMMPAETADALPAVLQRIAALKISPASFSAAV